MATTTSIERLTNTQLERVSGGGGPLPWGAEKAALAAVAERLQRFWGPNPIRFMAEPDISQAFQGVRTGSGRILVEKGGLVQERSFGATIEGDKARVRTQLLRSYY
jgi:hypothetical protein